MPESIWGKSGPAETRAGAKARGGHASCILGTAKGPEYLKQMRQSQGSQRKGQIGEGKGTVHVGL